MPASESEEKSNRPDTEPATFDVEPPELESETQGQPRRKPREMTPEEREELRKKLDAAKSSDPNLYPVF
jgi:hypothetical protein